MTSSVSINTQAKNTHSHLLMFSHIHTQVVRHQSGPVVMSFHLSFIFILQFHHSLASLPASLLSSFFFLPYCFSSSLHRSFILFLIQARCFSFCLFPSHIKPLARSFSLPQASCVYISVVYFYKCQTVFLPSVY